SIKVVVPLKGFNQEVIDREPDRTAPVGVPAKHPGWRVSGRVFHRIRLPANLDTERALPVDGGERANAMRGEKFRFVQDPAQKAFEALAVWKGEQCAH